MKIFLTLILVATMATACSSACDDAGKDLCASLASFRLLPNAANYQAISQKLGVVSAECDENGYEADATCNSDLAWGACYENSINNGGDGSQCN